MLLILDGWGLNEDKLISALAAAKTPTMDDLMKTAPHATLVTYGEEVGLPAGQMGNSEVGHLNIGAGRVVYQELSRINNAIVDDSLKELPAFKDAIHTAQASGATLHLMGLVSDGGVHSHIDHLRSICHTLDDQGVESVKIHAFLDGRDTAPTGGEMYLRQLEELLDPMDHVKLASVIGRYYAMDRDRRWERTKKAYDLLVHGQADQQVVCLSEAVAKMYQREITDEFMIPIKSKDFAPIKSGDVVVFFNYRTDRPRQITQALTQSGLTEEGMDSLNLHFVTMTPYDEAFQGLHILFDKEILPATLGEVISKNGGTQVRAAETEKYPHVTYFFSGGREEAYEGETRILVPSPAVATYDLQPEMSARELTDKTLAEIDARQADFVCLNFANTDMVGHTGDFEAAVKAAETVDAELARILAKAEEKNYAVVIIADHGNADVMIKPDGSPHTAHTTNLVPIIVIDDQVEALRDGILADVAPTILDIMGLEVSEHMTGKSLIL